MAANSNNVSMLQKITTLLVGVILGGGIVVAICFFLLGLRPDNSRANYNTTSVSDILETGEKVECAVSSVGDVEQLSLLEPSLRNLDYLYQRIGECDLATLEKLLTISLTLEWSAWRSRLQQAAIELIAEQSPLLAIELVNSFSETERPAMLIHIIRVLSEENVELALELANEARVTDRQQLWDAIFAQRDELTIEQLAELASTYGFDNEYSSFIEREKIFEKLDEQPGNAFDLLLRDDKISDIDFYDLSLLAVEHWYQEKGVTLLEHLDAANLDHVLYDELLEQAVNADRIGALQVTANLPLDRRTSLGLKIVEHWPTEKLPELIDTVESLPISQYRTTLMRRVFHIWAKERPLEFLENILDVPRRERQSAVQEALGEIVSEDPDQTFLHLNQLQSIPGAIGASTKTAIVEAWSRNAPDEALVWVEENVSLGSRERSEMMYTLVVEYAKTNPETAMQLAVRESTNDGKGAYLEFMVIESLLARDQIDVAISQLKHIELDRRVDSSSTVGHKLVEIGRLDDVAILTDEFSQEQKLEFYVSITGRLSLGNTATALNVLSKIRPNTLQSKVAKTLLDTYSAFAEFSDSQMNELKSYIAD